MKTYDLRAIRQQLPRGGIARIAEHLNVAPRIVGDVLNRGWQPRYRDAVVRTAISVIKEKDPDAELLLQAEEMKLVADNPGIPWGHRKEKRNPVRNYQKVKAEYDKIQGLLDEASGEDEEYLQDRLKELEDELDSFGNPGNPGNPGLFAGRNLVVSFGIIALLLLALIPQLRNWIFSRLGIKNIKTV